MVDAKRRKLILKRAQMRGCVMEPDALSALERYLDDAGKDLTVVLPEVLDVIAESSGESRGRIRGEDMQAALATLRDDLDVSAPGEPGAQHFDTAVVVPISAIPNVLWSERHKKFAHDTLSHATLLPSPMERAKVLQNRFYTIKQRIFRVINFTNPHQSVYADASASGLFMKHVRQNADESHSLYRLSSLEGSSGAQGMTVLARLSRSDEEGAAMHLEDDTMRIRVSVSEEVLGGMATGIFFDGCIVVARGKHRSDGVFLCEELALPPPEPREASLAALSSHVDFFGLPPTQNHIPALEARLSASTSTIFFLSQVTLDRKTTLQRVSSFIRGVAQMTATFESKGVTIVFSGNFLDKRFCYSDTLGAAGATGESAGGIAGFASLLGQLGTTVAAASSAVAQNAHFILIPGENDPAVLGGGLAFPMHPFPAFVAEGLRKRLQHVTLSANPSRLRFLTKELMVFRDEVQARLLSKALIPPVGEAGNVSVVSTLASQAHLLPLPPRFAPISAAQDAAMRLYPLPDLMVLCDRDKSWSYPYMGCPFVNPGSFTRNGTFLMYEPRTGQYDIQLVPL